MWTDSEYEDWMNGHERWMPFHNIGLTCPSCGRRGLERIGERLYRCTRNGCPSRGDTRMLLVMDGYASTYYPSLALAIDRERQ
jgi:hypothetical protein